LVEWRSPKPQVGGSKPSWPANTCIVNMNSNIEVISKKIPGIFGWAGVAVVTVLAFLGKYYFKFSAPSQAIMWLSWFILTLLFLYFTAKGKQVFVFAQESKLELQKVVWPARAETVQTTMIVMAMVAVTGFVLWAVDLSMMWIIGKITHLG
jgi:preprotein translocase subunit SecE